MDLTGVKDIGCRRPDIASAAAGTPAPADMPEQVPAVAGQADRTAVGVWKPTSCGCCGGWVDHMRPAGFTVKVHEVDDRTPLEGPVGVPESLGSCHTVQVGGHVIEEHVPADDVKRLLSERPRAGASARAGHAHGRGAWTWGRASPMRRS